MIVYTRKGSQRCGKSLAHFRIRSQGKDISPLYVILIALVESLEFMMTIDHQSWSMCHAADYKSLCFRSQLIPRPLTLQTVTAHYIADNASTPQDRNNNSATPTRATTIVRLAFTTLTSLAQRKTTKSWQHRPEHAYDPTFEICRRKAITTGGMCEGGNWFFH